MDTEKQKPWQMNGAVEAAKAYRMQYLGSPAEDYMTARGLADVASQFVIGYVGTARTGDERLTGYLAIPYARPAGGQHSVATVRYRCIADTCVKDADGNYLAPGKKENHEGHGKYRSLPGDMPRLYNTREFCKPGGVIAITEGEFDTMTSVQAGVPTVGRQGVKSWRPYFNCLFEGYQVVYVIEDGDAPGIASAAELAAEIPGARTISLGDGMDVNKFVHKQGIVEYRKRLGL